MAFSFLVSLFGQGPIHAYPHKLCYLYLDRKFIIWNLKLLSYTLLSVSYFSHKKFTRLLSLKKLFRNLPWSISLHAKCNLYRKAMLIFSWLSTQQVVYFLKSVHYWRNIFSLTLWDFIYLCLTINEFDFVFQCQLWRPCCSSWIYSNRRPCLSINQNTSMPNLRLFADSIVCNFSNLLLLILSQT